MIDQSKCQLQSFYSMNFNCEKIPVLSYMLAFVANSKFSFGRFYVTISSKKIRIITISDRRSLLKFCFVSWAMFSATSLWIFSRILFGILSWQDWVFLINKSIKSFAVFQIVSRSEYASYERQPRGLMSRANKNHLPKVSTNYPQ